MSISNMALNSLLLTILPQNVGSLFIEPKNIAWIVHPRDFADITKKISFLKFFPEKIAKKIAEMVRPFIISKFYEGDQFKGYVIGIPLSARQLTEDRKLALKRMQQALTLASKLGAETISLAGALTSIVEKNNLKEEFGMNFFDGTKLLPVLVFEKIQDLIEREYPDSNNISVGIIGATTNVGSLISNLISQLSIKELHFFGKTESNLVKLRENCATVNKHISIKTHTDLRELKNCDINILSAYINNEDGKGVEHFIKSNSFFLGAIEPVSPFVFKLKEHREDVHVLPGVIIKTPNISYQGYDFGLPKGNSFVCLAETILFSNKQNAHMQFSSNKTQATEKANQLLKSHNFEPAWEKK